MSLFDVESTDELDQLCRSEKDLILLMLKENFLIRTPECGVCGQIMVLRPSTNYSTWGCCPEEDKPPRSVREGSWFGQHPDIRLRTMVKIVILYAKGFVDSEICQHIQDSGTEMNINLLPIVSHIRTQLEDMCSVIVGTYAPIGGPKVKVQLREVQLARKTQERVTFVSALFGVETESGRWFARQIGINNAYHIKMALDRWILASTFDDDTDFGQMGGDAIEEVISKVKTPIVRLGENSRVQGYLHELMVRSVSGRYFLRQLFSQMQLAKRPPNPRPCPKTTTFLRDALISCYRQGKAQRNFVPQEPVLKGSPLIRANPAEPMRAKPARKRWAKEYSTWVRTDQINPSEPPAEKMIKLEETEDIKQEATTSGMNGNVMLEEDGSVNALTLLNESPQPSPVKSVVRQEPKKRLTGQFAVARVLLRNEPPPIEHLHPMIKMPPKIKIWDIASPEHLDELCQSELDLIVMMMEQNFLPRDPPCFNCGRTMTLRLRGKANDTAAEWRCRDSRNRRDCSSRSVRTGSWFSSSAMSLKILIKMLHMWGRGDSPMTLATTLKISLSTIISYREMFKDICLRILNTYQPLGGPGHNVEVAHYYLATRRFGRGVRVPETNYILVGFDMNTGRCFIELEPSKREEQIMAVLMKWVKIGSNVNGVVFDGLSIPPLSSGKDTERILKEIQPTKLQNMTTQAFPGYMAEVTVRLTEKENFMKKVMSWMTCGRTEALPPMDRASAKRNQDELRLMAEMPVLNEEICIKPEELIPADEKPDLSTLLEEKPDLNALIDEKPEITLFVQQKAELNAADLLGEN